jgi:hypothetical protein
MKTMIIAVASAATALMIACLPSFAHFAVDAGQGDSEYPKFYVPYAEGFGDPRGLTKPGVSLSVSSSASSEDWPEFYVPYAGGFGDPRQLTKPGPSLSESSSLSKSSSPLADAVREANSRFADVNAAVAEGYAPIPCVSGIDGGAMGIHYVNGDYLKDDAVDIGKPEAVMYEPKADGSMQLVAVEYITFKGPAELGGHLFSFTNKPNRYGLEPFYELHVWAWRDNPTGVTADMNPNVSCDEAHEHHQ